MIGAGIFWRAKLSLAQRLAFRELENTQLIIQITDKEKQTVDLMDAVCAYC
jgi:hypothetical protein